MDQSLPETLSLEDRVSAFEKELAALTAKYNLQIVPVPHFSIYRILPPEIQLAIEVLKKNGVAYRFSYQDVKKD